MQKRRFNPLALLALLSLMGFVGFITSNPVWFGWFGWLVWLKYMWHPIDERFRNNFSKASRNSFWVAMAGVSALVVMKGLHVSDDYVSPTLAALLLVMLLSFVSSFYYYEKLGE